MNNVIVKLVLKSIHKDKKTYLFIFTILLLTFSVIFTFFTIQNQQEEIKIQNLKNQYGNWYFKTENLDLDVIEYLKSQDVSLVNLSVDHDIACYQQDYMDMYHITLLEGREPETSREVAIADRNISLGQSITIHKQVFKVVGILSDYGKDLKVPYIKYFTKSLSTKKYYTYLMYSKLTDQLIEKNELTGIYNQQVYTSISINNNHKITLNNDIKDQEHKLIGFLAAGTALILMLVYILKKREFIQLQLIAITQKQLYYYIFIENALLLVSAIAVASVFCILSEVCISFYDYVKYHIWLFQIPVIKILENTGMYILLLMLFLIFAFIVFFSKNHIRNKKTYHCFRNHHFKMNLQGIAIKEILEHKVLTLLLILSMIFMENIYIHAIQYTSNQSNDMTYHYEITSNTSFHDSSQLPYTEEFDLLEESIISIFEYHNQSYFKEEYLSEGRYPESKNECVYVRKVSDDYLNIFEVGDTCTIITDEGYSYKVTITGIIKPGSLDEYNNYIDDAGALLVGANNNIPWHYIIHKTSTVNQYIELSHQGKCLYSSDGGNDSYKMNKKALYIISAFFMTVYLVTVMYYYVYILQKNLNQMRVFALSRKENIKIIQLILVFCMLCLLLWNYVMQYTVFILLYVIAVMMICSFVMVPGTIDIKTGERL